MNYFFMERPLDVIGRGRTILDVKNDRVYLTPGDAPGGGVPGVDVIERDRRYTPRGCQKDFSKRRAR